MKGSSCNYTLELWTRSKHTGPHGCFKTRAAATKAARALVRRGGDNALVDIVKKEPTRGGPFWKTVSTLR